MPNIIINKKSFSAKKLICLFLYYGFARFLPCSFAPIFGRVSKKIRYTLCKQIFKECGRNVNIERMAMFGSGAEIKIGDNSGIGINCTVPSDIIIGKNVMMGPNCYILSFNHRFDRFDIPMCEQGFSSRKITIIEDDVWIGREVLMTPGRHIQTGTIIAARTVLCKDFQEYSIIGGNPSKLIKLRKPEQ